MRQQEGDPSLLAPSVLQHWNRTLMWSWQRLLPLLPLPVLQLLRVGPLQPPPLLLQPPLPLTAATWCLQGLLQPILTTATTG
jgi:hypothetical protein